MNPITTTKYWEMCDVNRCRNPKVIRGWTRKRCGVSELGVCREHIRMIIGFENMEDWEIDKVLEREHGAIIS